MMWSTVAKVRFGKRTGQAHLAEHREGLRARDLVDQVGADQQLGLVGAGVVVGGEDGSIRGRERRYRPLPIPRRPT